jgi:hypothetical protein
MIAVDGCDDMTLCMVELLPEQKAFLDDLFSTTNRHSESRCQPKIRFAEFQEFMDYGCREVVYGDKSFERVCL